MKYESVYDVLDALVKGYYFERDLDRTMSCVTDDIQWVGTEQVDSVSGKAELRELLSMDMNSFPQAFEIEMDDPVVQKLSESIVMLIVNGRQISAQNMVYNFSVRATVCCVKDKNGWLVSSVHTSVPNSEMEKYMLAQKLDETRRKEATLMASIPGGVAIYRVKKDGTFATDYVSEGYARVCGYTAQEFLTYMREDARRNLISEDVDSVTKAIHEGLKRNEPIHVTYHVYRKDQSVILVQLDANAIAEDTLNGDELAVLYAVHTKVSNDAKRLLVEQERYRTILDNLDAAYFEWDNDKEFYCSEKYSQYAMSKLEIGDIIHSTASLESVHPEDHKLIRRFFDMKQKKQSKASVILRMKMMDGTYRWTEVMGFFEYDRLGHMTRLIGVLRDVDNEWLRQNKRLRTALKEAEQANQAKTDFLSRVSHDMRTPLNGILGLTTLLQNHIADRKAREDLLQLEQSGKYLLNLINDTLDVSKIESERLELNPTVCDGKVVFHNVVNLINPNLKEKNITMHVHADKLPFTTLYIDVGRVEQIVMNILGNAIKFTPYGGTIDFYMENLSVENGVITDRIIVKDNGIGISEDFLPHIFEPFSQEHNTSTSNSKGTGLGMAITKQIIELMGGEIQVESEVQKGTTFTMILPLPMATKEQIASWKKAQDTDYSKNTLDGKRILLCEDHPLNATIAIRLLEHRGMRVIHAENGQAGVSLFERSMPGYFDAVLMDIRMPIMNGLDATAAIRNMEREDAQTVPIIAMTANAFTEDINETQKMGMNAHLSKPIETEKLFQVLEELI